MRATVPWPLGILLKPLQLIPDPLPDLMESRDSFSGCLKVQRFLNLPVSHTLCAQCNPKAKEGSPGSEEELMGSRILPGVTGLA